jgi:RND family efflux transporter MFP subunit
MSPNGRRLPSALALTSILVAALLFGGCARRTSQEKKELELVAVSVTHPHYQKISDTLEIIGTIKASSEVIVLSETSGRIVSMPARIGATVAVDAPLVMVDKDLREAAFLAAEAAYRKASKDAERIAALHEDKLISDAEAESAALGEISARSQYLAAKKELDNTTVRAPIGGVIADTYVGLGEQLGPGSRVAQIVDSSRLKVRVLLPEGSALRQRAGNEVALSSDLFPGRSFVGKIESIGIRGDEAHSFPTDVILKGEAASLLRAGMSVRLGFAGGARQVLLIPRSAIVGSLRSPKVFIVEGGLARERAIVAGEEYGTEVEVISGLEEGDLAVVTGQTLLSDAQSVRVVDQG